MQKEIYSDPEEERDRKMIEKAEKETEEILGIVNLLDLARQGFYEIRENKEKNEVSIFDPRKKEVVWLGTWDDFIKYSAELQLLDEDNMLRNMKDAA